MTIQTAIEPDRSAPGQAVLVSDDAEMTRRGYAGREGVIESLCGPDLPGMARVAFGAEGRTTPPVYAILPLASLTPVRRTRPPADLD
jgi:hypothetical protein